ncbi:gliding motility associated protein GldN [Arcicella aurantiaca]|uniref:Gliding motility associated protein GldN n=1 Tax=Arcicella aurantiaca TaxID=591202 RepID=A0A316EK97_9BACT|nr:gliding motility protein GldN [Arcicella aurantiaca]PWK23380.1 gliding motility associated protein GldN [Arcicella aurantiaca]
MKNLSKIASVVLLSMTTCTWVSAQEKDNKGKNPDSVRPIDESNIMWKQRLWRRMDLNEKQNQPFFSKGNEITKYLIEWVQSGVLQPYRNDSLKTKISKEDFMKNLVMENSIGDNALSDAEKAAGFGTESGGTAAADDGWGDPKPKTPANGTANDGFNGPKPSSSGGEYYFPKELSVLEIREDAIFDKQRSRLYYDIQSITVIIPANKTTAGFDKNVASFKYKDLDKLFRSNPNCVWYNEQNEAQHKNMADAFDLRLFHARLTKKGNSKDDDLDTIYGGAKQGMVQSQQLEYKLMEMEHNLWEY